MKKLVLIALAVVLVFTLVACSSYGKVQSALEGIGFKAIENSDEANDIKDESEIAVTFHTFSNADSLAVTEMYKLSLVIVIEFNSTDEMKEFYSESDTLQGFIKDVEEDGTAQEFYDALVDKGLAKGNCLVFAINPVVASDVATAIKNA